MSAGPVATQMDVGVIWLALPKEPAIAYETFCLYRDTPPRERSLAKLAKKVKRPLSTVSRWSSKWNWVERAAAYTAHLDAIAVAAHEDVVAQRRREVSERAFAIGQNMTAIGNARLVGGVVGKKKVAGIDPNLLEADDTVRMLVEGDRLSRLALGLPTDVRGNIVISVNDFHRIIGGFVDAAEKYLTPEEHAALVMECSAMVRERLGSL